MIDDLVKRAGRGVGWNMSSQIVQQAIRFIVIIVLTRLLAPGDFGIFAMVLVFTEFIAPFREWGFQAALIQRENIDEEYQSTAFWSISGFAVLIYFLSCLSAPSIGRFFNSALVGQIIPAIALIFLVSPFGSIQWVLLTRKLNFRILAFIQMAATFFYGLSACLLAFRGYGVWSFIWATLIMEASRSIMFWISYRWRPLFKFSFVKFKELLSFATSCTGSGVLNYGINNFDNLMVGKCLGAAPLGFYNLAFNTVSQPQMRVVSQITSVAFPVYSRIKDDKERLREVYLKTIKMIAAISVPLIAIIFVATRDFVLVFYGPKWLPAVLPIKIMSLFGLIRALTSVAGPIFLSQGKPNIEFKLTVFRLFVFAGFVSYGVTRGINGVALAVLVYSLVNFFPTFYLSNRLLDIKQSRFYAPVFKYFILCLVIIAILIMEELIYQRFALNNVLLRLVFSVAVGLLSSFFLLKSFLRGDYHALVDLIKEVIR